jgi:hypothetical protein
MKRAGLSEVIELLVEVLAQRAVGPQTGDGKQWVGFSKLGLRLWNLQLSANQLRHAQTGLVRFVP